jgi:hypothetical protein
MYPAGLAVGTSEAPVMPATTRKTRRGVLGDEGEHVAVEGVLHGEDEADLREPAVDLLRRLREARLAVERLAVLLDEEHLGAGAGHRVGAEELERVDELLVAGVLDELGDRGAARRLGEHVLHLLAEADLAHLTSEGEGGWGGGKGFRGWGGGQ